MSQAPGQSEAADGGRAVDDERGAITQQPTVPATRSEAKPLREGTPRLWHVYGPQLAEPRAAELGTEALLVGRDVAAPGFKVRDSQMSRLHFRVVQDPRLGVYRIGDSASTNGTFVNGKRVTTALLEPSSVIRAGNSLFVLEDDSAARYLDDRAEEAGSSSLTVLVLGETGTGKEWLARRIHAAGSRGGPFVAMNCATLQAELAAAELFGHTRGAFSGASQDRSGLFVAADGGTLFLDEIADLAPHLQPMLLRVLEDKRVRPVGSDREVPVDVRIIAACHVDLEIAAQEGRFRPDLYARLSQIVLRLAPLCARRVEVASLLRAISDELSIDAQPTPDAMEALLLWRWPYNVRELRSLLQAFASFRRSGAALDSDFLTRQRPELTAPLVDREGVLDARTSAGADRERLRKALEAHQGNIAAVAAMFGKPRAQVYRWLRALGLSADSYRAKRGRGE